MRLNDAVLLLMKLLVLKICQACRSAEYEIEGQCCPMCSAGHRVYNHCTDDTSTTCVSCTQLTYTDHPNGLIKCLACTVCDEGAGLRLKRACSLSANALCQPLPGYYCTDVHGNNCRKARKHSTCLPGQYINQTGTEVKDTVCLDCPKNTYSSGSSTVCRPHRTCESTGLTTVSVGTNTADYECSNERSRHHAIITAPLLGLLILGVVFCSICCRRKGRTEDEQSGGEREKTTRCCLDQAQCWII